MLNLIKVHVAAELKLVRTGFVSIINSINDFVVNDQSSNGPELLNSLRGHNSDVFIISGEFINNKEIDLISFFSEYPFSFKVIIVSTSSNILLVRDLIKYGASGYLLSDEASDFIENAIQVVNNNGIYLSEKIRSVFAEYELDPSNVDKIQDFNIISKILSPQELQVLRLMCENYDYTSGAIGDELGGKTASQIRTVISRIKIKLNIKSNKSKIAIVKYAQTRRLFE